MVNDKVIHSIKDTYKIYNIITLELDNQLKINVGGCPFKNYIYNDRYQNKYAIRYPGATRGHIEVDDNNIIVKIKIYHDEYHTDNIYKSTVENAMKKFIGYKFEIS